MGRTDTRSKARKGGGGLQRVGLPDRDREGRAKTPILHCGRKIDAWEGTENKQQRCEIISGGKWVVSEFTIDKRECRGEKKRKRKRTQPNRRQDGSAR